MKVCLLTILLCHCQGFITTLSAWIVLLFKCHKRHFSSTLVLLLFYFCLNSWPICQLDLSFGLCLSSSVQSLLHIRLGHLSYGNLYGSVMGQSDRLKNARRNKSCSRTMLCSARWQVVFCYLPWAIRERATDRERKERERQIGLIGWMTGVWFILQTAGQQQWRQKHQAQHGW